MTNVIPEYKTSSKKVPITEYDSRYLNKYFNNKKKDRIILKKDGRVINNGPWVGVIQLEKSRIELCTKIDTNFLYILSYLNDIDSFIYDPKKVIDSKQGYLFFDVITKLFVQEFDRLKQKGLIKKYLKKREKLKFLKGKLIIKKQVQSSRRDYFCCEYDDLTFNNLLNKSILYTSNLLRTHTHKTDIKPKLLRIENYLSNDVELEEINPHQLLSINYNKINSHYEQIIKLCYHIINKIYSSSVETGKGICFNFLVDMNQVYEDFITKFLLDIVSEEYPGLEAIPQGEIDSIVIQGKRFRQRPDIIIKDEKSVKLVLDIKYKEDKIPPADFYQITSYLLSTNAEKGVLVYEKLSDSNLYSVVKKDYIGKRKVTVEYFSLNVFDFISDSDFESLSEFEDSVCEYISERLREILK